MPAAVNSLRIGETILLGVDTLTREPTLDLHLEGPAEIVFSGDDPTELLAAVATEIDRLPLETVAAPVAPVHVRLDPDFWVEREGTLTPIEVMFP